MHLLFRFFAAMAVCGMFASQAAAADLTDKSVEFGTDKAWQLNITPINGLFMWGVDMRLAAPGTDTANVSISPIRFLELINPIVRALNYIVLPTVEVRRNRIGLIADAFLVGLESTTPASGLVFSSITSRVQTKTASAVASYRFVETDRYWLEATAGGRLWHADFTIVTSGGLLLPGIGIRRANTWGDPIIGLQGRYNITDTIYLSAYGNIGGLAASDVTWDVFGKIGYDAGEYVDLYAGMRYIGVKFRDKGTIFDFSVYSPAVGLTLKF